MNQNKEMRLNLNHIFKPPLTGYINISMSESKNYLTHKKAQDYFVFF